MCILRCVTVSSSLSSPTHPYLSLTNHPPLQLLYERDIDSYAVILEKAVERGFLAVPGISFMPAGGPTNHVRISFSLTNGPEAEEACKRLRDTILEVRGDKPAA